MAHVATVNLVTGRANEPHITSYDTSEFNKAIFGNASRAIDAPIEAELVDNNTVRIHQGKVIMQGRFIRIEENVIVTIDSEKSGLKRYDTIYLAYCRSTATGKEWAYIGKTVGTPAASNPEIPEVSEDTIDESCTESQMRLFDVFVNGTAIPVIYRKNYVTMLGSCNGILACNGNGIFQAAEAGRDYQAPLVCGIWQPNISGASGSYYTKTGRYTIVGNVAMISFAISGYNNATDLDEIKITGFPLKLDGKAYGSGICEVKTGDVGYAFSGFMMYSDDNNSYIVPRGVHGSNTISYTCYDIPMTTGTFEIGGTIIAPLDEQELV